jgi:hypothetical protein
MEKLKTLPSSTVLPPMEARTGALLVRVKLAVTVQSVVMALVVYLVPERLPPHVPPTDAV